MKTRINRAKAGLIIAASLAGAVLTIFLTQQITLWFDHNKVEYHPLIKITRTDLGLAVALNRPISINKRQPEVRYVGQDELDTLVASSSNPPIAKYIVEKFGPVHGIEALAVARAESGLREDAINLNKGQSLDIGIFQINSVHWSKPGCGLKDLVDAYKNVDCAYQIWQAQGFEPWVAWQLNMHLAFMSN